MTDPSIPYPTPPAVVAAPPRRPIWPWILGGVLLLVALLVAGGITAVTALVSAGAGPRSTLLAFDKAYRTADCDLFESTMTPGFESDTFGDPFDCEAWQEDAAAFVVDGQYAYTLVVVAVKEEANTAEVTTVETDTSTDEPISSSGTYELVRQGDRWLIDGYRDGGY